MSLQVLFDKWGCHTIDEVDSLLQFFAAALAATTMKEV